MNANSRRGSYENMVAKFIWFIMCVQQAEHNTWGLLRDVGGLGASEHRRIVTYSRHGTNRV